MTIGDSHVVIATFKEGFFRKTDRLIISTRLWVKKPNLICIILVYKTTFGAGKNSPLSCGEQPISKNEIKSTNHWKLSWSKLQNLRSCRTTWMKFVHFIRMTLKWSCCCPSYRHSTHTSKQWTNKQHRFRFWLLNDIFCLSHLGKHLYFHK